MGPRHFHPYATIFGHQDTVAMLQQHFLKYNAVRGVVFHDLHVKIAFLIGLVAGVSGLDALTRRDFKRQAQPEPSALAQFAFHTNFATHRPRQPGRDGKAKTGALPDAECVTVQFWQVRQIAQRQGRAGFRSHMAQKLTGQGLRKVKKTLLLFRNCHACGDFQSRHCPFARGPHFMAHHGHEVGLGLFNRRSIVTAARPSHPSGVQPDGSATAQTRPSGSRPPERCPQPKLIEHLALVGRLLMADSARL